MASVTATSGFDAGYPLKGAAAAGERTAGGYYSNAAQKGEAPGRWFGPGAAALGLTGEVDHDAYLALYGDRPADPRTGEPLGRKKMDFTRSYKQRLAALRAAEPHAASDRVVELERQARRDTRQSPAYTDITSEQAKSVSIVHGSIRENARRAREAGDERAAAWWDAREQQFSEILQEANRLALEYLQEQAGVTRSGYHGARVNGRELGRWEPAELIVSSWQQGTSRAGEMHDHIHNAVHPKVRTVSDGKWRGFDSMAARYQLAGMAAIESAYIEAALSRDFGVEWVPRADGMGNEIRGITQAEIDAYSSRRQQVTENLARLAQDFRAAHGRQPNQREMRMLDEQAWAIGRPAKEDQRLMTGEGKGARIDWDKAARLWDEQLGGKLGEIVARVTDLRGPDVTQPASRSPVHADPALQARSARQALAAVQAKLPAWTRADLMRQVQIALPAHAKGLDPLAAVAMIADLTDRALLGEFEQVESVEAPQVVPVPQALRGPDGRNPYERPGSQRFCTRIQLSIEERLLADAQAGAAPWLTREQSARLLGVDPDVLDETLRSRAAAGRGADRAGCGLRMDQAAALHQILTSPRTGEVLVGPAGSGKTRTLAEAARAWIEATGGQVIGLATAQAARNVLAAAGVELAHNSAQFLGHVPGERGARGARELQPGSLLVVDEASMMSTADLADIMSLARARGCKVIAAGDNQQLAAVEGGGAMMLLARRLGYVQLAEAVRFEAAWEREASLGLRRGEIAALDEYDDHGRITGDEPDRALDIARSQYVAHYLAGTDVLLIARARETCRELSRRVREDLVHLGKVDDSRTVTLKAGAKAGAGDVIIARQNDHDLEAGQEGRTLANGDVLRVEAVNDDGSVTVVRRTGKDDAGQALWSESFRFADLENADLGYAVTGHSAQGLTVGVGLAVVTGSEGRQWFYTAMTRGAHLNRAFVYTRQRDADISEGTAPAPELGRHGRILRERAGLAPERRERAREPRGTLAGGRVDLVDQADPRDARAVVADVLERDDSQESALEIRDRERSDADHLARLGVMWDGEGRAARISRYREAVRDAIGDRAGELDGGTAMWLWRTLEHAEAGGLDASLVVRAAVAERSMTGARDVAAVLDARIRTRVGGLAPAPWQPLSERVPVTGDKVRDVFLAELAAAMDDRIDRLGQHTADTAPAWAVSRLGPVPEDPAERAAWAERAKFPAAYREWYGFGDEREAIGPEPVNSPRARSLWFAAYGAISRADDAGLDALPDGDLWLRCAQHEAETAWAPQYPGRELRLARSAVLETAAQAAIADARAKVAREAGDDAAARRHETIAASARSATGLLQQVITADEGLMSDWQEWSERTAGSRLTAVQAHAALQRRHPDERLEPLKSAEPEPAEEKLPEMDDEAVAARVAGVRERREAFRERMDQRAGLLVPSEDPDAVEGEAWPAWLPAEREAILQPPKPLLPASGRVAEREPGPVAEAQ